MSDHEIAVDAPAKVNLILHVLAREPGGYHQIETLFQRLALADSLTVRVTDGPSSLDVVWCDAPATNLGPADENLAWRAALAYHRATGWPLGWNIEIVKRIPAGAGLGGGSSNAAAVLAALNTLAASPLPDAELLRIGASLGSDVPFFVSGASLALGRGRGERLVQLNPLPSARVQLIMPGFPISTSEAYADLAAARAKAAVPPARPALHDEDDYSTWKAIAARSGNDFEATVFTTYPELDVCQRRLEQAGATIALLSGSGSTVFGVWTNDAAPTGTLMPPPRSQLIATRTA